MDAPAVVGVMFRNAMKRTDNEGTYYAFRVEVTARTASASYALVHLRVGGACKSVWTRAIFLTIPCPVLAASHVVRQPGSAPPRSRAAPSRLPRQDMDGAV